LLFFSIALNLLYYVAFFWQVSVYTDQIVAVSPSQTVETSNNIMMLVMPILSVFCNYMAYRGVAADIILLRDADRLR